MKAADFWLTDNFMSLRVELPPYFSFVTGSAISMVLRDRRARPGSHPRGPRHNGFRTLNSP